MLILTVIFYSLLVLAFSIYSYSQIDLNLTLSANRLYQEFQKQLIYLGYYNRPLSAAIYFLLIVLMFIFYFHILRLSKVKKFPLVKLIFILLGLNIVIAVISYPALSHDFFNYLFDARIVTRYHLNPYQYKALDFPADLWIRFMHWTHRTYPYGPLWLAVTLPFSFLGFGKFVLTLVLFKVMFLIFYLSNIFLIWKISNNKANNSPVLPVLLYAFNPLIIIETLVSPHNENVMLFFLLLSIYFLQVKKSHLKSLISLLASVGIKFVTLVLLPLFFLKKLSLNLQLFLKLSLLLLMIPLIMEIFYRQAYPWYFIPLIGIAVLIPSEFIGKIIIALSFGALLRYIPYLYSGTYSSQGYSQMNLFLLLPVIIVLSISFINMIIRN
ncbi:hypothetical protein A2W14_03930 [Candidatus Gottesmanbacteria bacterium RBG_16_37_8]|uniref:Glycosyltransferase RgtA/B/C/D-like domain-containing protein n=1 Tax=Candidatus Gottesmanbacteria bacterium RBG_16_37_8 TaxID=1798371 RepID=A0A1F5YQI7_9BACT|nr:MAG: hypothetical protein A2W14_03930 [Candidatus Gottesmanbacteria bacterium RBG_16_37_8]